MPTLFHLKFKSSAKLINCSFTSKLHFLLYWTIKSASLFLKLTSPALLCPPVISAVAGRAAPVAGAGSGRAGAAETGDRSGNQAPSQWVVSGPLGPGQSLPGQCRLCFSVQMVTNKWQGGHNKPLSLHTGCQVYTESGPVSIVPVLFSRTVVSMRQQLQMLKERYYNMSQ